MPELNLSPAGWLSFLNTKLSAQQQAVAAPESYYNGVQRLAFATAKFREAFSRFFPPMANNWMKLVVEAPVSRLEVTGFRFDPDPSKPNWDQEADQDAWAIWQANNLDAGSMIAHREAIKAGVAYLLVSPPPDDGAEPLITVERPDQCYVHRDALRRRVAAIKRWVDDDGYAYATIYLPTLLYKWRSVEKYDERRGGWESVQWRRRVDDPVESNPIGVVSMIPLENVPDLRYGGRSDLETVMPIQDAVNKFCLDMQVSGEFHAFPQRWAAGWERATTPDGRELTGREQEVTFSQTRLIRSTSTDTKFGTFDQGDVQNYIAPIELYVDHMAAISQTPAYYLKGKMANLSAEALHAADAGLVDRCRAKIKGGFSDGWEETMRVAFRAKGDTRRATATMAEALWADPEIKSIAQTVDAAVKMRESLSTPVEMCWELLGWSPQKIRQAKRIMNLPDQPPGRPGAPGGSGSSPPAATRTLSLPPGVRV